ncbi:MAG: hypothetical protein J7L96_10285 [Bacteroidales bacterium]|nr:hypothetical protein [Bacteroidales bacterium]
MKWKKLLRVIKVGMFSWKVMFDWARFRKESEEWVCPKCKMKGADILPFGVAIVYDEQGNTINERDILHVADWIYNCRHCAFAERKSVSFSKRVRLRKDETPKKESDMVA